MPHKELDELARRTNLASLSNVVLINGRPAESSQSHLEKKIHERVDKEFPNPKKKERAIIEELKDRHLRFAERTIKQQRDGEYFVQIKENVREKDVHLFHKFSDKNLDLLELLVMGDALQRAGVQSVTLYLPYIPYQRQDKKDDGRVPISAKLMFNLFNASFGNRLKRIVTTDLHARQAQGYWDGPVDELSAVPEFAAYYRHQFRAELADDPSSVLVFSPDAGGGKRADYLAKLLKTRFHVLTKRRTGHGKAETRYYVDLDVEGKKIIIIDDMIDSGSSLVGEFEHGKDGPVQYLRKLGAEVYVCATHAILSEKGGIPAEERFRQAGASVLFTDSLPEKNPGYYLDNRDWMRVISLDHAMAKAFYCNQLGESISKFLRGRERRLQGEKLDFVVSDGYDGTFDVE